MSFSALGVYFVGTNVVIIGTSGLPLVPRLDIQKHILNVLPTKILYLAFFLSQEEGVRSWSPVF
jgi:hypothetical protein